MNLELQIVDHSAKLKVDGRDIETNVTNLNMVIRTLEAHRDHMTAREFFDATVAQVDFRNPSEAKISAFLRQVIDKGQLETPKPGDSPEHDILIGRGLLTCTIMYNYRHTIPTARGIWALAEIDGVSPDHALANFNAKCVWGGIHP